MIDFFDTESPSIDLDFATDYLKANPKRDQDIFHIHSIKLAKSGKGYMLYTNEFMCWLFKKEKTATQLIEALEYYVKVGGGFQLVVKLDKKAKNNVVYGIDKDIPCSYFPLGKGFSCLEEDSETPLSNMNPFLVTLPSTPLIPVPAPYLDGEEGSGEEIPPASQKRGQKGSVRSLKVRE